MWVSLKYGKLAGARRPVGVKSQDELLTGMLTLLKSGVDAHMHAASVALGHCHPDHLPILNPVRSWFFYCLCCFCFS